MKASPPFVIPRSESDEEPAVLPAPAQSRFLAALEMTKTNPKPCAPSIFCVRIFIIGNELSFPGDSPECGFTRGAL
jgi:hypothetical protein